MKSAVIYTFTKIYSPTVMFEGKTPYISAMLENDEGERFMAFVEGESQENSVAIGKRVYEQSYDERNIPTYTLIAG